MPSVNMHEAKTHLSKLVKALVSGAEKEITLAQNGKPVVRMTAIKSEKPKRRFGFAKGRFTFDHEASDRLDAEIEKLFEESADPYGEKLDR